MRIGKGWYWAAVLGVALLALIGWRVATRNQPNAKGGFSKGGSSKGGPGGFSKRPASVEVATAKPADIVSTINVVGTVQSPQTVNIAPRISGQITYLALRQGDRVKAGQVLVKIDPSDLRQQILQQQAAVAEAQSRLAQAQLTQGSTNVGVTTQIQQQQAGLTSAQADANQTQQNYSAQVQTAQAAVSDNEAKLNAAQVGVQNANAQLAQQQANLKNAQTNYLRMETLYQQGAVSQQARDDALTAMQVQQQAVNVAQGQVAAAQAGVSSAEAGVSSAKSQLSIVKKQGQANIAAAHAKVLQAKASVQAAVANRSQSPAYQANINALRSAVAAAQAQYESAKVNLEYTVLKSPINGAVTARNADPGSMASPNQPILTIQALDWVYVNAAIPVESIVGVREGMNAQVTIDALPGQVFNGPITNINPSADPQTRQFGISIRLQNPGGLLKPGMYARVEIITQSVHAPVAVPLEAIAKGQSPTVTVIDKDSVAHVVPVTLGASDGKTVQITSGVRAGDQVVTLSYSPVQDGQQVTLPGAAGESGSTGGSGGRHHGSGSGRRGGGSRL